MRSGKETESEARAQRSRGALVGLAVGNIFGLPFEGMSGVEVRRITPGGGLQPPLRELARPWDDDLAMAMELAEHLAEAAEDVRGDRLLERYVRWYQENGRGIGGLTQEVLELARSGSQAAPAERVWRLRGGSGGTTAGNGAIMRVAPVGIRFRRDANRVISNALADARLTHWEPLCQWSAAGAAILVADRIEERVTPLDELFPTLGCPAPLLRRLMEEAPIDIESAPFDGPDMGYTLNAWKVALWASHAPGGFPEILQRVIRCGGDTDTNGAVAGAVLGARFGERSIPPVWLEAVHDIEKIRVAARRLHELGARPATPSTGKGQECPTLQ